MAIETTEVFLEILQKSGLVDAEQLAEARSAAVQAADAKALARHLMRREWLTPWQAGQLLIGRRAFFVGKYKLMELLGRGGMGKVFLARHTMMNRPVALKFLSGASGKDRGTLERFLTEARAVAALDHPNIVHAYNVDNEGDNYYMVLEYVEGQDLERLVQESGPLDCERAADYVRQAAEGLAHAHGKGLIHCDIKPSNLLVNPQGVVKILDMGMARLGGGAAGSASDPQGLVGTIDYMAPEQAAQSPELDARVDLYSLGCTLYFLLTGHPPFPEGTLTERLVKHQTQEPKGIVDERPGAPRDLARICQRLMAKRPDDRFGSADEVAAALAEWRPPEKRVLRAVALDEPADEMPAADAAPAAGPPDRPAPAAPVDPAVSSWPKRKFVVAGAAAGGAAVVVGLILFFVLRRGASDAAPSSGPAPVAAAPAKREPDRWKGLEPTIEQPPSETKGTAEPAETEGKQPAKEAKAEAKDAKPEVKPEAKEPPKPPSKPETKPETKPEAKTSEPEAKTSKPDEKPAAKVEGKTEPSKPDMPKEAPKAPPGDPWKDFPKTVDLPEGQDPAALGRIGVAADVPWSLELVGGDVAAPGKRTFALGPREHEGKPGWVVTLAATKGKEETVVEIARLYRERNTLMFQWLEGADAMAEHLRNCLLDVRAGEAPRPLALRAPVKADPLTIDFLKGISGTVELTALPNPAVLKVQIVKLLAAGDAETLYAVEPSEPAPPKKPIVVSILRKDLYNQENPVLRFQGMAQATSKGIAFHIAYRKNPALAIPPPKGTNLQHLRLRLADPMDALANQLKDEKKQNDQKLRAQKDALDLQLWLIDTYEALQGKGTVHFRIFAEVAGRELDLARTEAPSPKPPPKPGAKK